MKIELILKEYKYYLEQYYTKFDKEKILNKKGYEDFQKNYFWTLNSEIKDYKPIHFEQMLYQIKMFERLCKNV